MTTSLRRLARQERGNISLFVAGLIVALLAVTGLAYDGIHKMTMAGNAANYAQAAGHAGAQAVDTAGLLAHGTFALNPQAAVSAADAYLDTGALKEQGVTGSAQFVGTNTLVVTVTVTEPTVFLGLIGITSQTVTATCTTTLLFGVNAPE